MNTIVQMIFGSHLYGTDTPTSDMDYKGIFLPTFKEVVLNKIPKSISTNTKTTGQPGVKNTSEDVDSEIYSLQYFIKLALEGQTVAIDMLHAPEKVIIDYNYIWKAIVRNREKFYTKNLNAFVGYARKQAAKYGIRGSRINEANMFLAFLRKYEPRFFNLSGIWDILPLGEHINIYKNSDNGIRQVQVCGKIFQETVKLNYIIVALEKFVDSYGERARQAANNEGIDWKAMSHAIRAALQMKELFTDNTITFPLKEAELLKTIKQGRLDYNTEVAPLLESLMYEVEILSEKSSLPEKPDVKFWENFIINVYKDEWGIDPDDF